MDQAWDPAQDGQPDVDKEIGAAPALEEDRQLEDNVSYPRDTCQAMQRRGLTGGMKMAMK